MNNEERKDKQEFLFKSIIQKGIPAEVFEDYLLHIKEDALDVDNWTRDELSRVVDLFYQQNENNKISKLFQENNIKTVSHPQHNETVEYIEIIE